MQSSGDVASPYPLTPPSEKQQQTRRKKKRKKIHEAGKQKDELKKKVISINTSILVISVNLLTNQLIDWPTDQ